MKTEYDADAAFLYPYTGEQERRFFYALMLRSRGEKSLDLQGFTDAFLTR
jgi:hypothetical protein